MNAEARAELASTLRSKLDSRRDTFVINGELFEDQRIAWEADPAKPEQKPKTVSAAALKLLLDYCDNMEWTMSLAEYCANIFHSRAPEPGETAFSLLPDVRDRLSADRLGFWHIYGGR